MNEKVLEKKGCEAVKKVGGIAIKLLPFQFTGLPDRLILLPAGIARFAEFKTTGKTLSPRQKLVIELLRSLGFKVDVVDNEMSLEKFKQDIAK